MLAFRNVASFSYLEMLLFFRQKCCIVIDTELVLESNK